VLWAGLLAGRRPAWVPRAVAAGMVAEAVGFAHGLNRQADPALDYPPIPALEQIKAGPDGRAMPLFCLHPNLMAANRVREVRGYDSLDPRPVLDVLDRVRAETMDSSPSYARTMSYVPKLTASAAGGLRLPPALDLLGLRYLVTHHRFFPMLPPAQPTAGYYVYENPRAVPRAFFPARVEAVGSEVAALNRVVSADFDPRAVAVVARPLAGPPEAKGDARVTAEVPARVTVAADTPTGGLLVLADQWAAGWAVAVDGTPAELVRADFAVKGVVVPPGAHEVVFTYWPPGLTRGLTAAGAGLVLVAGWVGVGRRQSRRR
jgi:hypothetical protein